MNYIVFDLEWNQCPYGKEQENERIPFEIIEIGAVKLDSDKKIIDEYHTLIQFIRNCIFVRRRLFAWI